jgi:signal transduction histidine kinase
MQLVRQSTLANNLTSLAQAGCAVLTKEEKKYCESTLKNSLFSSIMLMNLINDLLDLAKIENNAIGFKLNETWFNLHEVI